MTRLLLASSVGAAAMLLVPATSSGAAAHSVTVVSRSGLPAGFTFATTNSAPDACTLQAATASTAHTTGPGTAPLGQGSLTITSAGGSELREAFNASESALTSFQVASIASSSTAAHAVIMAVNSQGLGWQLTSQLPAGGWTTTNVLTDPNMLWWQRTTPGSSWDTSGQGTYADFVSGDPNVQLSGIAITVDSCSTSSAESASIDALKVGVSGVTTTDDFEPLATTLTPHLSARSVVAGGTVTPSVTMKVPGTTLHEVTVTLSERTLGSSSYRTVTSALVDARGTATGPAQHPSDTTSYRWTYAAPDGNAYGSAASTTTTVHVSPKVTVTTPKTVAAHHPLVITGRASPASKGLAVTLWRRTGKHAVKLTVGAEKSNGSFRLSKRLSAGTYRIYVTVAADGAHGGGRSPIKRVTAH